jgi:hypothetical protein
VVNICRIVAGAERVQLGPVLKFSKASSGRVGADATLGRPWRQVFPKNSRRRHAIRQEAPFEDRHRGGSMCVVMRSDLAGFASGIAPAASRTLRRRLRVSCSHDAPIHNRVPPAASDCRVAGIMAQGKR